MPRRNHEVPVSKGDEVEAPVENEQEQKFEVFKTTLTIYTDDRDSFKIDLGNISEAQVKEHVAMLLGAMRTIRESDGVLLQNTNGAIHIVNVNHVTHFEVRTN